MKYKPAQVREETHTKLKVEAAKKGMTIDQYINYLRSVERKIN